MSRVYLNGEFLLASEAKISVFDRGFLLGDGVYEVIPAYSGKLFRLDEHLSRLQRSLDAIHLKNPYSNKEWEDILTCLVEFNPHPELSIYFQVTRGIAVRDHAFPENVVPTIFAMANPIHAVAPDLFEKGVAIITLRDNRWLRCDIKAISLLPNVLLRQQAVEQGVTESVLVRDGNVTEGAASNVFIVEQGRILTPPKNEFLLPGITRDLVLELAQANGLAYAEEVFSEERLLNADEVWLSSSTKEILPVTRVNDRPVGNGKPGEIWKKMQVLYAEYKKSLHH